MTHPTPWSLGEDAAGSRWITAADGFRVASVSAMADGDAEMIVSAVNATGALRLDYRRGAADALRVARERVEALPNTSGGHWDTTWNDATGTTDHYHECHGLDRAAVLAALAQPAPAAPPDEGITQRAHVPCCWCREHHEEGAI